MKRLALSVLTFIALSVSGPWNLAQAEVRLPKIVGDSMVLQRDKPIPIWGWDTPGTDVTVSLGAASAKSKADGTGYWQVELPAMPAGGPFTLTVQGSSSATLKDILVGEVWLCSGQSNMEWTVTQSDNPEQEIAAANHPRIRHIKINHTPAEKPQTEVPSNGWQVCTPQTAGAFTGVGYYFARQLHQELDVPIGLIGSNWGGTRIEPWTPPVGFQQTPALQSITDNLSKFPIKRGDGTVDHQTPLALYNGMIHPLLPYSIRGAIWYQGESNNGEGMLYHEKMKALISGWRSVWKSPEMPFYFVQLAPFRYTRPIPGPDSPGNRPHIARDPEDLARIWEAQATTLTVPHTGMAVTTDIGHITDIHPRNKQAVGQRLARWALARDYGKDDLVVSGPLYKSMQVEGNKIRITFDHVGGGLSTRDGQPLNWFTIAGEDKKFVDAHAVIDGASVVVHADSVPSPVAVRFGWHQEAEPNFCNKEGLPGSPFRTDGR